MEELNAEMNVGGHFEQNDIIADEVLFGMTSENYDLIFDNESLPINSRKKRTFEACLYFLLNIRLWIRSPTA